MLSEGHSPSVEGYTAYRTWRHLAYILSQIKAKHKLEFMFRRNKIKALAHFEREPLC